VIVVDLGDKLVNVQFQSVFIGLQLSLADLLLVVGGHQIVIFEHEGI